MQSRDNPNQYRLPYEARKDELLAQVRLLRNVPTSLTPARQDRAIDLLERLLLRAREDLIEINGRVEVRAHMTALAAIHGRTLVSDRAVRNWRAWAEEIGVLDTEHRSHVYGRREWNLFSINVNVIREMIRANFEPLSEGGSGRKWPEGSSGPRAEGSSGPRAEGSSGLTTKYLHIRKDNKQPPPHPAVELPAGLEDLVVVVVSLGVARATEALTKAVRLGMDRTAIQTRIDHYRGLPDQEQIPGKLYNWLALPRSFDREPLVEQRLELAPGLDGPSEHRRANLIRYGRQQGWEHARLQAAVRKFESECRSTCPQVDS